MLKRVDSNFNNSLGPSLHDDLTALNYLAFARCIAGYEINGQVKYITVNESLDIYKLHERNYIEYAEYKDDYKRRKLFGSKQSRKKCSIKVYHTESGEEKIFKNQLEAGEFLNMSKAGIYYLLKTGSTSKQGWKAEYYEVGGEI